MSGLGEAWKKSEILAERRQKKEEMKKLSEEKFTAQKRAEFLALVRNGHHDKSKIRIWNDISRPESLAASTWEPENIQSWRGQRESELGNQTWPAYDLMCCEDVMIITDLRCPLCSRVRQEAGEHEEAVHEERGGGLHHQTPGNWHHERPQSYQPRLLVVQLPQPGGQEGLGETFPEAEKSQKE